MFKNKKQFFNSLDYKLVRCRFDTTFNNLLFNFWISINARDDLYKYNKNKYDEYV